MSIYYDDGRVTLHHGDALENDAWRLEGDVLVTDPPYGMAYVSNSSRYGSTAPIAGDDTVDARDKALRPAATRQILVWDKGNSPGMGDLKLPWGPSWEEVYVLGEGFQGKRGGAVIRIKTIPAGSKDRPNHPTPKPIPLMETLIEKCPPGVIVDPFAGSGSTLLAAVNLGRRAIGVELDERYCELIAARLSARTETFIFEEA